MATININGIECSFPKVPYGTLESYGATSRTHYLAYAIPEDQLISATICAMLQCAYHIGALARAPFYVQDGTDGRAIVLIENPSATVLDSITSWLTWSVGNNRWQHRYPYQRAIVELRLKAEQDAKDTHRTLDLMRYDNLYRCTLTAGNPINATD